MLHLFLACLPLKPAPAESTPDSTSPPATVSLRMGAYLPSGAEDDCSILLDGAVESTCDAWVEWPATTVSVAIGDGAATSVDGLPLHVADDGSTWVTPPHEVDLAQAAPYYSDWIVSQEEDVWSGTLTLNRYVDGLWDCVRDRDDGEGEGEGAMAPADTWTAANIEVLEGRWLTLDPAFELSTSRTIEVKGDGLIVTDPDGAEGAWSVGEDTLSLGLWGSGDGSWSFQIDCTRSP